MIERGLDLSSVVSCLSLGVLLVVVVGVVFKKTSRAQHVVGSADEGAAGSLRSAVGWLGTAVCGLGVGESMRAEFSTHTELKKGPW